MCDDIQWIILDVSWEITGTTHKNADLKKQVSNWGPDNGVKSFMESHEFCDIFLGKNCVVIVCDDS